MVEIVAAEVEAVAQIEVVVALLIGVAGVAAVLAVVGAVTVVEVAVVAVLIVVEAAVQVVVAVVTAVEADPGVVAALRKITECVNTGHKYCSSKLKSVKFQNERAKILDTFADL